VSEILFTSSSRGGVPPRRRRTSRSRRVVRGVALLLIAAGALAMLDAVVTLLWQEPISALYARLKQDHLSGALRKVERAAPTPLERRALASLPDQQARITFLAGELERHSREGSAVGRIVIPRIGASFVIVKGTSNGDLQGGPGIYSETRFPGTPGTTAVAGHRTTYLAPFRHIDALRPGNRILVEMPYAHLAYTVVAQRVVSPTNVQAAVADVGYTRLVLSACTPLFSAEKRLLVYARLTRTVPAGAARRLPGGALAQTIEAPRTRRAPIVRQPLPAVLEPLQSHLLPPLSQ
jgi:sortase A